MRGTASLAMDPRPSRRRAWLAALFSFVLPGAGQLIGGRFIRAGALLCLQVLVDAAAVALLMFLPLGAAGIALAVLVFLAWRFLAAYDAYRINVDPNVRKPHTAVVWVAATGLFAIAVYVAGMATDTVRWRVAGTSYKIPAASMAPTLLNGDYLLTRRLEDRPVRRGEILVFRWPADTTRSFIKRVVGLPGDTLTMRAGILEVNGQRERPDYVLRTDSTSDPTGEEFAWQQAHIVAAGKASRSDSAPTRDNWGPLVIPERSYFVLGDNRDNSLDSRYWGFVRQEHLQARPWRIYFSRDPDTGDVRWDRIGLFMREP